MGDANEGFRAGKPAAPPNLAFTVGFTRVTRKPGYWEARTPVRGTWLGLPVVAIYQALPEGGDPGDFTVELAAPPAEAERRLRAAGFPTRAGVEVPLGPPDGYLHAMSLLSVPGRKNRSLFSCGYS